LRTVPFPEPLNPVMMTNGVFLLPFAISFMGVLTVKESCLKPRRQRGEKSQDCP
jgi:hypothetical protein